MFALEEVSDLRIGLRHFAPTVFDWACVDNFSLVYLKDDPTGIGSIERGETTTDTSIYNLAGQKMRDSQNGKGKLPKGIYIVGGKKTAIR